MHQNPTQNLYTHIKSYLTCINPLSANPTKWSNTLKQFVGNFPGNCLSVFNHFVGSALKGLTIFSKFSKGKWFIYLHGLAQISLKLTTNLKVIPAKHLHCDEDLFRVATRKQF